MTSSSPVYIDSADSSDSDSIPMAAAAAPTQVWPLVPRSEDEKRPFKGAKRPRAAIGEAGDLTKCVRFGFVLYHDDLAGYEVVEPSGDQRNRLVYFNEDIAEYLSYQLERCPDTGRLHLQGFVRLKKRLTFRTLTSKMFGVGCVPHYDPQTYGTDETMRAYSMKERTRVRGPWEYGVFNAENKPGRRSDLRMACDQLLQHRDIAKLSTDHPCFLVRYPNGFAKLLENTKTKPPSTRPMRVTVIWGGAGLGKTTTAYKMAQEACGEDPFPADLERPETCFDEYEGQKFLLLDEFDWRKTSIHFFKKICQKFKLIVKARYHNHFAAWEHVVICCNSSPDEWWTGPEIVGKVNGDDIKAVFRRLDECRYYTGFDTYTVTPIFDQFGNRVLE